jgi:hypothetical protein
MPTTIPQYVDPSLIPHSSPGNAYSGSVGTSGGPQTNHGPNSGALGGMGGAALDGLLPGLGGGINILSGGSGDWTNYDPSGGLGLLQSLGLFGGDENTFQPYINEQGQYVFQDPNRRNPVPVSNVPGASLAPDRSGRQLANQTQSIYNLLPYLSSALANSGITGAIGDLNASRATSPGYAELQANLYNTYGPIMNQIGNQIQDQNALASASRDNAVLTGPGRDLVSNAYDLSQIYDKPYYDSRQKSSDALAKLFDSIDLSGGLSPTERDEIGKGLTREGISRGTANSPSQTDTVANAMRYGAAGHARQQEAKSNLSDAIGKAAAFLPTAKSGVDVFQTATGRSSSANPGQSLFTGAQTGSSQQNAFGLAGNLLGSGTQLQMNNDTIQSQKKDWLDKFNQIASGIGSITGSLGSVAGAACWVAREVYGVNNPNWIKFRHWMLIYSPKWFRQLYLEEGARLAEFIKDKPVLKSLIKKFMDSKI